MVTSMRVDGVDISHWQSGALDFSAAKKAGVKFVYHKATEGVTVKDSNYTKRRAEAKAAGVPFGAYHFARAQTPLKSDAVAEAKYFLSVAKPVEGDLYPVLDLETTEGLTNAQLREWAAAFIGELSEQGFKCVLYTNFDLGNVGAHLLWTARYSNANTLPKLSGWDIWQFSNGVYGVPKSVAGFGNVDLNTMRAGLKVSDFQIPKKEVVPPVVTPKTITLKTAHASMQFSDSTAQQKQDVEKIFSRGYDVIGGTEAGHGSGELVGLIKDACTKYGYSFSKPGRYDTWVAVKNSIITKGTLVKGSEFALWRSSKTTPTPPGRWGDKGVVWAQWDMPGVGTITFGAVHYLTHKGAGPKYKPESDKIYASVIDKWSKSHGAGDKLVFLSGDFNLVDKNNDVFKGLANLSTCWDDLKKWPNTGHGNIDAIARFKADTQVKTKAARVLDDGKLFLNTDHFLIEAEYTITVSGTTPTTPDRMDPSSYFIGATGSHVTWLGQRLVAHGFGKHYTSGPGPKFTEADRKNVADFQKAQGWTGADADGFPGKETLKRLAANPVKPTPTPTPTPTKPVVELAKLVKAAKTDPGAKQGHQTYAAGVKVVEAALLKEGLLDKKYASDGSFGSVTVKAYSAWQKKLGYKGKDADGIPGATTLKKLGSKHGFTVK